MIETKLENIKIVAGFLVENESLYVKYSLGAIYPFVDHIVVVDGGSTDNTVEQIRALDTDKKITILQQPFMNRYGEARNVYLKYIRDHLWDPWSHDRLYYFRIDADEFYTSVKLAKLKEFILQNLDKQGFRFNMAVLDKTHWTLNEVAPKETRANLFAFNPNIKYHGDIHELPYYQTHGFQIPLYGAQETDLELGIEEVPP